VESTKQETRKKAERVLTATLNAIASGDYLSPEDRKTTVAHLWQGLVADYRVNEKAI
jgi:uncharacterized protein (DUF2267 family)